MRTKLILTLTLLALAQLLPGSAAQAAGDSGYVATGGNYCLLQSSLLRADGVGNGYSRGRVRSFKEDCGTPRNRPVPYLAQTLYVYFMKTQGDKPRLCAYTEFYYNNKTEAGFTLELPFPETPYCGPGWYNIAAYGSIWENDRWNGGPVESGWEHLSL